MTIFGVDVPEFFDNGQFRSSEVVTFAIQKWLRIIIPLAWFLVVMGFAIFAFRCFKIVGIIAEYVAFGKPLKYFGRRNTFGLMKKRTKPETTLNVLKRIKAEKLRAKKLSSVIQPNSINDATQIRHVTNISETSNNGREKTRKPILKHTGVIIHEDIHHQYHRAWSPEKMMLANEPFSEPLSNRTNS
ncbi:hypothetical protein DdX_02454 [Ditylenchus destructor]|uniref:Uncharacterized protein n=1 Tax=Ditylenchus destructor TaxID=166010 RepID=A0AAD4R616_9BILA|nr:hypothetical protein DdX_02454 [Ditylenchus destructor]